MNPRRTVKICFTLLLLAMVPLRGFAAIADCGAAAQASMADHAQGADHAQDAEYAHHAGHACHHTPAAVHTHCADCCLAAAALLLPPRWSIPWGVAPYLSDRAIAAPPAIALDRLDRPPRSPLDR